MLRVIAILMFLLAACGPQRPTTGGPDARTAADPVEDVRAPVVEHNRVDWTRTIDRACEDLCSRLNVEDVGACHYECVQTVHPTCEVLIP